MPRAGDILSTLSWLAYSGEELRRTHHLAATLSEQETASRMCSRLRVRQSGVHRWIESSEFEPPRTPHGATRVSRPVSNGLRALLPQENEGASVWGPPQVSTRPN